MPAVEALNEVSRHVFDRSGSGFSTIHYVAPGAPLPEAPARKALTQSVKEFQDTMRSAAVIVEGGGFWASALRSFVTGLSMFSKAKSDMRVFSEHRLAIDWTIEIQNDTLATADTLNELLIGLIPARHPPS